MASFSITKEERQALKSSVPFTRYDLGWVVLCIGSAIGSGIVFMPIQIGLKGIWVFLAAMCISYPAVFLLQELYLKTLSQTEKAESYASIISIYLGKNWGIVLGVCYFVMTSFGIMIYSLAVTYDSASYLQTFGVTEGRLSDHAWYGLILMSVLVAIAYRGERMLFKVSGPMILGKLIIVVLLGVVMVPYWNFGNITAFPEIHHFIRDVILTVPFVAFSIIFVMLLSPMNIAFRKENSPQVATYRAIRVHRLAYLILIVAILFFAFSFTFSISHEQAVEAFQQNISALAIAA